MNDWSRGDVYRLGVFLEAGLFPEKAVALVELVRAIETSGDHADRARKLLSVVDRLIQRGMTAYDAHTALLAHLSEHEPYVAIGSKCLSELEVN